MIKNTKLQEQLAFLDSCVLQPKNAVLAAKKLIQDLSEHTGDFQVREYVNDDRWISIDRQSKGAGYFISIRNIRDVLSIRLYFGNKQIETSEISGDIYDYIVNVFCEKLI